jgi:hypothetical protein
MTKYILQLTFIIISVLLCSCDPGCQIRYSVVNKTQSTLNITVTPPKDVGLGASYNLKPNDEVIIYETHTMGYASSIIEKKPMNSEFLNCLELTKDSMPIKIDIHNSTAWTPENIADTLAMYRLIIKSDKVQ